MARRGSGGIFLVAMVGAVASVSACAAASAGPSAGPLATATATVAKAAPPVATRAATPTPAPSKPVPGTVLVPQAVVDVPGARDAIAITAERSADGDVAVWTGGDGTAWRIDPATNTTTSVPVDIDGSSWTGLAVYDGDLWGVDFRAGRIVRVDASTGRVVATIDTPHPTLLTPARGGLWFTHELEGGVSHIDVKHNRIDMDIRPALGLGSGASSIWFTRDTSASAGRDAVEVDAVTGQEKRVVHIPDGVGCTFIPDVRIREWTWCTPSATSTTVAMIDLASGRVSSFQSDRSYVGGLIDAAGATWALVGATSDQPAAVIQLGPDGPTGVGAALPPEVDPDWPVVADGSLWIPSDGTGKVFRFDLDALLDVQ